MFPASEKVRSGIVFALLIVAISAASVPSFATSEPSDATSAAAQQSDVKKMQQALFDRGRYRGKVDGVIGLRTRASLRSFQKAEKLPATGWLDPQTAAKLGVKPESIGSSRGAGQDLVEGKNEPGNQTAKGKPWAGTRLVKSTRRTRGTFPKVVSSGADTEGSSKERREDGLRAENQKRPQ